MTKDLAWLWPNDTVRLGFEYCYSHVREMPPGRANFLLCFRLCKMGVRLRIYLLNASSPAQRMQRRRLPR